MSLSITRKTNVIPPTLLREPMTPTPIAAVGRRNRSLGRSAFSLVELIVVMVILGMLAGLVAVRTRGYLVNSRKNAVKAELAEILKALETYRIDQSRYPTEDEGLEILTEGTETFVEGFLNKVPVDPWKNPYVYFLTEDGVEVISLGADGREGGEGEDADLSSKMLE
ncbi:MAG: type II secretion system major pseudopilin GspG [Planctomycetota bacterium]